MMMVGTFCAEMCVVNVVSSAVPLEQCGANWTTRNTLVVCSFVIKIVYAISYFMLQFT